MKTTLNLKILKVVDPLNIDKYMIKFGTEEVYMAAANNVFVSYCIETELLELTPRYLTP